MTNLLMNINKPTLYPNLNQTSPVIFVKVLFAKFFFNTLAKVLTLKTFQLYSNPLQCITTCSVLIRVVLHLYTSQLRVVDTCVINPIGYDGSTYWPQALEIV